MTQSTRYIPPPPRLLPYDELPAIIEPPLRDLVAFPVTNAIEEWEPFICGTAENLLTEERVDSARNNALADERVTRLLKGKKYISIGASLLEKRDEPKRTTLVFIFYNYTDNLAIEVSLDHDAQKVTDVLEKRYQPAPLQSEIDQVVTLARKDNRLGKYLEDQDDLEGTAILVSPVDPHASNYGHRIFDVRFVCPTERLARYMAIVDLSTETVLKCGSVCGLLSNINEEKCHE
jgi:hypothetical protein